MAHELGKSGAQFGLQKLEGILRRAELGGGQRRGQLGVRGVRVVLQRLAVECAAQLDLAADPAALEAEVGQRRDRRRIAPQPRSSRLPVAVAVLVTVSAVAVAVGVASLTCPVMEKIWWTF